MQNKVVILNWKMEPQTEEEARMLLTNTARILARSACELYVAPPFVYLESLEKILGSLPREVRLCAQDIAKEKEGAHTGEVSPQMLLDASVKAVLVGHSERRTQEHESDLTVAEKLQRAGEAGIIPVLCIGESYETLLLGEMQVRGFLSEQLRSALVPLGNSNRKTEVLVAYEPVWAISSQRIKTADPVVVHRTGEWIKQALQSDYGFLKTRLLYGGSVASLTARPYIESYVFHGFLVGAASLEEKFLRQLASLL